MRSARPQEQTNARVGRLYTTWLVGDGAATEFALPKNVARLDDFWVSVAGLVLRPADSSGAYDYQVRGITPGYAGDKNMVRFSVVPAAAANIGVHINGD